MEIKNILRVLSFVVNITTIYVLTFIFGIDLYISLSITLVMTIINYIDGLVKASYSNEKLIYFMSMMSISINIIIIHILLFYNINVGYTCLLTIVPAIVNYIEGNTK